MLEMSKDKSIRQIAEEMKISKSVVGATLKKVKIIPTPIQEEDTMISQNKANTFLSAIAPSSNPNPNPNPKEIARRDAVINNLMGGPPVGLEVKKKRTYAKKTNLPVFNTEDNTENKASLVSRITLNVNTFEPILRDFVKPNKDTYLATLAKKSEEELAIILKTMEHSRSVFNVSTQLRSFVYMGSSAIEYGTQKFMHMKTEGFAQALMTHDQEIRMCLAEYCMDKVETFQKINRPEAKLASIIVLTLLSVDAKNRMSAQAPPANVAVAEEVAQEYKDL